MKEGKNNASNLQCKSQSNKRAWASHWWGRFTTGTSYILLLKILVLSWVEPAEDLPAGGLCCSFRWKWTKQNLIQVIKKRQTNVTHFCTDEKLWGDERNWLRTESLGLIIFKVMFWYKTLSCIIFMILFNISITSASCDALYYCLVLTLLYLAELCMTIQRARNLISAICHPFSPFAPVYAIQLPTHWARQY